jgi:hypothetical protein
MAGREQLSYGQTVITGDVMRLWADAENRSRTRARLMQEGEAITHYPYELPFSDLIGRIQEGDLMWGAYKALPLARLAGIKQLSFLTFVRPDSQKQLSTGFDHDRLGHSVPVGKIMEVVLRRNPNPDKSAAEFEHIIEAAVTAGLAHDMGTVGGGEALKKIDPENLDEETHWKDVLDKKAKRFLKSRGITIGQLDKMIHNEGLLGQVLDIADRISYVMLDFDQLLRVESTEAAIERAGQGDYEGAERAQTLNADFNLGSIYRDIDIDWETQQVYFKDPTRLGKFLSLRAFLTANLYKHPISLARDYMVGEVIRPYYFADELKRGTMLTPSRLRRMTDDDVLDFIARQPGGFTGSLFQTLRWQRDDYGSIMNWSPDGYEMFNLEEEARQRQRELNMGGNVLLSGIVESKRFNTATNYLVKNDEGEIVPFGDCEPGWAASIEAMADSTEGFLLFWQYQANAVV